MSNEEAQGPILRFMVIRLEMQEFQCASVMVTLRVLEVPKVISMPPVVHGENM